MAVAVTVPDGAAAKSSAEAEADEEVSKVRRPGPTMAYLRSLAWVRPVLILAALYLVALAAILALFAQLPSLGQMAEKHGSAGAGGAPERLHLAVPHSFDELRAVRRTLELYRSNYGLHVAALLVATHVFLQTFMVPGSILVNILAGSMYSLPAATGFAVAADCAGASSNYWLARWLLRDVVAGLFPARVQAFASEMKKHQSNLLNYNLFIRTAPIFPSWVVNLASPIVGVPFPVFITALVAGHLPINFISVKAGHNLAQMQSVGEMYSAGNVLILLSAGALALVPVLLRRLRRGDRVARRHAKLLPIVAHGAGGGGAAAAAGAVAGSVASAAAAAQKAAQKAIKLPGGLALVPPGQPRRQDSGHES